MDAYFRPLILAVPCAGELLIAMLLAVPTMLLPITLALLFCNTFAETALAAGGIPVTSMRTEAFADEPIVFEAIYLKLSIPTYPGVGV